MGRLDPRPHNPEPGAPAALEEDALPRPPIPPAGLSREDEPVVAPPAPRRAPPRFGVMDVVWFLPRLALKILRPKLLDRYVMGELLGPLLFGWTMFMILLVFTVDLFKLTQYLARGARPQIVGELFYLRIVLSSVMCIPMAMLLSGLLAFGRLSGESEVIATQAGGISNGRLIWNAFLLGLVLSCAGLFLNEKVIPPAGKRFHFLESMVRAELLMRYAANVTGEKAWIVQDLDDDGRLERLVAALRFEPEDPPRPALMREVTYIQYEKGLIQSVVQAERAEWVTPDKEGHRKQQWKFIKARVHFLSNVSKGERWVMEPHDMLLTLNKTPEQIVLEQKDADQMTYGELKKTIYDMKASRANLHSIRQMDVAMERKLSVPFAAVVLALIGAPLGIRRQRSSTGVGIGISLLVIMAYYILMNFMGVMGEGGRLGPVEAAWGANAVGLVVGLYLTWRASR